MNLTHVTTGVIGAADADIMVSLKEDHRPTADYVQKIRIAVAQTFLGSPSILLPADMITQILNFGLPSPIDVQIERCGHRQEPWGRRQDFGASAHGSRRGRCAHPAGFRLPHLRGQCRSHQGAAERSLGKRRRRAACSILLSGSFQTHADVFPEPEERRQLQPRHQTPQYAIQSLQDLQNICRSPAPARIRRSWLMSRRSADRKRWRRSIITISAA